MGSFVYQRTIRKLYHDENLNGKFNIKFSGFVTPTIHNISASSSGRVLSGLMQRNVPIVSIVLVFRFFVSLIPALILRKLLHYHLLGNKTGDGFENSVEGAYKIVKSGTVVNQALEMAKEEMLIIDTQDDINDWYFNHSNKGIKNWLFFARNDHWVANETREYLIDKYGNSDNTLCENTSSFIRWRVIFSAIRYFGSLLQEQNELHKGKQGFELVVVNLDEYELDSLNNRIQKVFPELLAKYQPVKISLNVLSLDSYVDEESLHRILLTPDFRAMSKSIDPTRVTLTEILRLCPNKSSAEDLLTIVYNDLILRVAAKEDCQTVVYGHCMTRLANEIIALTVKGRGSIIHKSIADHTETIDDKEIKVMFPLREILQAEISAYVKLAELNKYVISSTVQKSKINKNLTIRDLTTNYFKQLDATGYASTASTVAKTGEKLGSPSNVLCQCQICGADIHQNPSNWLKRITVTDPAAITTDEEKEYYEMFRASCLQTTKTKLTVIAQ
ncbi:hypothetical protein FOB64_004468 [Candida albicans]|uniref:Uncharacterized protein n=1 Tax=Candida albicans TaxID=5476 RepID=A0A8H6BZ20_CANAX|nr:hypothetical protein FOB64_004468 [Candida albicans]